MDGFFSEIDIENAIKWQDLAITLICPCVHHFLYNINIKIYIYVYVYRKEFEKKDGHVDTNSESKSNQVYALERAIDPQEAIALRRSGGALTGDEAKALLAVKRVFGDSKIIFRGPV